MEPANNERDRAPTKYLFLPSETSTTRNELHLGVSLKRPQLVNPK